MTQALYWVSIAFVAGFGASVGWRFCNQMVSIVQEFVHARAGGACPVCGLPPACGCAACVVPECRRKYRQYVASLDPTA